MQWHVYRRIELRNSMGMPRKPCRSSGERERAELIVKNLRERRLSMTKIAEALVVDRGPSATGEVLSSTSLRDTVGRNRCDPLDPPRRSEVKDLLEVAYRAGDPLECSTRDECRSAHSGLPAGSLRGKAKRGDLDHDDGRLWARWIALQLHRKLWSFTGDRAVLVVPIARSCVGLSECHSPNSGPPEQGEMDK